MTTAAAAAEYSANLGPDFTLADAYDPEYLDTDEVEDADLMGAAERQALNARMARLGVTEMSDLGAASKIMSTFGPWGLILIVLIYVLLKGQITFHYPRQKK